MIQTALDFTACRAAAERGMQQAIQHAECVDDTWPDAALAFLIRYARTCPEFTVEEMTAQADRMGYASPTDSRAWGPIVRRAALRGVIRNTHRTRPRVKGHGAPGILWASLVYVGDAA